MVETAPTGTEMPRRKRIPTPNFLSAHFRETEILFPLSHISVLSCWQVQSRRELINLALACDMAVCSLVSASLHTKGKTADTENSFFARTFWHICFLQWQRSAGGFPSTCPSQRLSDSICKLQLATLLPGLVTESCLFH